MIELTDWTLCQTDGDFDATCLLMNNDLTWMLISNAYVSNNFAAARYVMHFWYDGRAVIFDTDKSLQTNVTDEDLRELSEWCRKKGWKSLSVDDRLLVDRSMQEWWNRAFLAGLIYSEKLKNKEDEEMKRLNQSYNEEEK